MQSLILKALLPWFILGPVLAQSAGTEESLVLEQAPEVLRPYVLRKGSGQAVSVGQQVYRLSVTGNSSAGAFSLLQTNAPDSKHLGVLPHVHKLHFENFYCTKGRFQVWTKTNDTEQARILYQGDYAAVPQNTIHTFQILDPDSQGTGVIYPGGFERLFLSVSEQPYLSSAGSPYTPATAENSAGEQLNPDAIATWATYDVHAHLEFTPRRDLVNGSAGGSGYWHDGPNFLGPDSKTPNFIAKGYGPKYLNTDGGVYRIITPFATKNQTDGKFSQGTVTMSPKLSNQTAIHANLKQHVAFQLEEGSLVVNVTGYETSTLI
ncbi:quercetin 2,3-dioxygenase [Colletotrichum truncatum]|uniref:Quercetin 2,3-dioxygenase n=1 Tax=Colletotrichum truncatum TaxID=5467 RepID=A0ACC3YPA4_COLTU|nr:quercetin 2,3-dioxygenase [Colletotrichum truncatum]KAF6784204.1 quercetin 2,3-dioxygenase [Colletotrichum truncatum]